MCLMEPDMSIGPSLKPLVSERVKGDRKGKEVPRFIASSHGWNCRCSFSTHLDIRHFSFPETRADSGSQFDVPAEG
jgi:hypothetical protein